MATLATTHPTLLDLAKRLDPDNKIAAIIEILNETNEVLDDMVMMEGNLVTGHQHTIRTGIPRPTWRKLYGGVLPTKSETAQIVDTCGMMEAYAEVDKALADLNNNQSMFRLTEVRAHLEGMAQELAETIFYGNEGTTPASFTGLSPRYNARSGVENSENILHGGSADTDNTSVWLVVWGPGKVFGIYPKGSTGGIQERDHGEVTIENVDGAGGRMQAYRHHFRHDVGIAVADWRYVVRIANIEKSALTKDASAGADLIDLMVQALEIPPNLNGRPAFYVSRTIKSFLRRQMTNANNVRIGREEVAGKMVDTFDGIPVRRVDALAADEALVPA